MDHEDTELDRMQNAYKSSIDAWVAAVRAEEQLASVPHRVAQIDTWENAHFLAEEFRCKAEAAKARYEDALRLRFFTSDPSIDAALVEPDQYGCATDLLRSGQLQRWNAGQTSMHETRGATGGIERFDVFRRASAADRLC